MSKSSDARAERNRIRAHYEKKFAGKLREKDDSIKNLLREIDRLRTENKSLEERLSLERMTTMQLDELVKTLQRWSELSDSELAALKADLGARRDAVDALKSMDAMFRALPGGGDIQTDLYGLLAGQRYM